MESMGHESHNPDYIFDRQHAQPGKLGEVKTNAFRFNNIQQKIRNGSYHKLAVVPLAALVP